MVLRLHIVLRQELWCARTNAEADAEADAQADAHANAQAAHANAGPNSDVRRLSL